MDIQKNMRRRDDFSSIIAEDAHFKGKLKSSEEVLIAGKVVGDIEVHNTLYALPTARIEKNVAATNCSVQGAAIKADMYISENLSVLHNATISGTIQTATLQVENGAVINGALVMKANKEA